MKKLTDICDIQYGFAFDSKCFTEDPAYPPLVRIRDVKRGYSETYYSGDYPQEYVLKSGDLLIGMDGEFNIARWKSDGALLNQRVCKLTVRKGTNEEYLRFAMSKALKKIEQKTAFVTVKHLSAKELNKLQLYVPDLSEQNKVAEILSRLEAIIDVRRKELEKLDELTKARFVEMFGNPFENPYELPEATLPDLGEFGRGVSKHRPRNDPKLLGGDYPLIQTGDVANADLYISSYNATYSDLGLEQSKMWDKGTLCITIAANIAKTAILEFDACFPDSVVGFVANDKTSNIFIHYWFSFFQGILESQAPESAQKNINLKILSELKVIVPPIELQNEFVFFVTQVDKSKLAVQKSLEKTQQLFDSLMQEYFG